MPPYSLSTRMKAPRGTAPCCIGSPTKISLRSFFSASWNSLTASLWPSIDALIDDDAAAAGRLLHLLIEQEAGDGVDASNPSLASTSDRLGRRGEVGHRLPGQPHAFVVFLPAATILPGPGRALDQVDAVARIRAAPASPAHCPSLSVLPSASVRVSPSATPTGQTAPRPRAAMPDDVVVPRAATPRSSPSRRPSISSVMTPCRRQLGRRPAPA